MKYTNLYESSFIIKLCGGLILLSLLLLLLSLMTRLFVKLVIGNRNGYKFRINTETIYSISRLISEVLYALSVACCCVVVIFHYNLTITTRLIGNEIHSIILPFDILFMIGAVLLLVISPLFRITLSCRNKITSFIDLTILVGALLLMFSSVAVNSMSYFNYVIG